LLIVIFYSFTCTAQGTESRNAVRLEALESLSKALENKDVKKATTLARQGLIIASDSAAIERVNGWLGHLKRLESNYDSAIFFLNQAVAIGKQLHSALLANHLNEIGMVRRQQGRLTEAMDLHMQALANSEALQDKKQMATSYYNIGFVFNTEKSYDTALLYFKKSLALSELLKDTDGIASGYNGIGLAYMRMEKFSTAREWFLKAVVLIDEQKQPRLLAILYNNLGITHEDQGNYEKSREYYYKSLAIKKGFNDERGMASTYGNLADNFRQSGNLKEAIRLTHIGEKLARKTSSLDYIITSYKRLWLCYEEMGDYKRAFTNQSIFMRLQDSLFNGNKAKQIRELMTKYNVAKKEKENAELKGEIVRHESTVARQNIILSSAFVGLVLVIILLSIVYRFYTKSKIHEQELVLQQATTEALNHQLKSVLEENNTMMNIMVHDLRAPMNKVLGLADLIKYDGTINENQATYLNMMRDVVNQGRKIIDDLLTISKQESLLIESLDAKKFLSELVNQFSPDANRKKIDLQLIYPEHTVSLHTDKEALRRILDN
jgi:tetratricopeptide (TPR) repeat protein